MKERFFCVCCNKWNEPSVRDALRGVKIALTEEFYRKHDLYQELHFPNGYGKKINKISKQELNWRKINQANVYQKLHLGGFI